MKRSRASLTALALLAGTALVTQAPVIGQDQPESLLPPGFGDPVEEPPPEPRQPPPGQGPASILPTGPGGVAAAASAEDPLAEDDDESEDEEETAELPVYDLPDEARRSTALVGVLTPQNGGLAENAFGSANGAKLSALLRKTDAPIASRWLSILLRRTLLTRAATPQGVNGADWAAERAWLLMRMGEADAARMIVQGVDVDRYTPKLYQVAMQSALATGDVAALCPAVPGGVRMSGEPGWRLAEAMCAGLAGESANATSLLGRAGVRGVDSLLAEKVIGAGINSRRAVTIQWENVNQLTAWRFGLANATGVAIPEPLFATVGPHVLAWQARMPLASDAARAAAADRAAALGVFSSTALIDLYGAIEDAADPSERSGTTAEALRACYTGDASGRISAMRGLWNQPDGDAAQRYARLILTSHAAGALDPTEDAGGDSGRLIAAMFAAGKDIRAARWAPVVEEQGDLTGNLGWGLLAVGAPRPVFPVSAGQIADFAPDGGGDAELRARFLLAGLAGLGRITPAIADDVAADLGVPLALENNWTRALDVAVSQRQPGTVVVLAALGMQTRDWSKVPPHHLFRIVSALRRVGLEPEARMIAAEALTRA